ncbi:hypothetical protein LWI28_009185 [Acer negundo]|uniref:Uncharacterized protein n=1 Tax=Acer negundo TaxID=4023 RepID=A0AAD5J8W9_ACENE|nr:hypothetical protein LWI28_009185 [Acer negundo]KAK4853137.1 hypothetical protein QYF36_004421 [Acer negundo]
MATTARSSMAPASTTRTLTDNPIDGDNHEVINDIGHNCEDFNDSHKTPAPCRTDFSQDLRRLLAPAASLHRSPSLLGEDQKPGLVCPHSSCVALSQPILLTSLA